MLKSTFKSRHSKDCHDDKAQTTRNKIMGIYTTDKEQIVFIDTPGIHKLKTALEISWLNLPIALS